MKNADTFQAWIRQAQPKRDLAERFGVSYEAIRKWVHKGVPVTRLVEVCQISGFRPSEIRPDIDWQLLCRLNRGD